MKFSMKVNAAFANGQTIKQMSNILGQRMKYLHETARDSIAATAINILRGIRAVTKVAKKSSIKVDVKVDSNIYPSFTTQDKTKKFCLRIRGSNHRFVPSTERVVQTSRVPSKTQHCFRFEDQFGDKTLKYIIVAPSTAEAKAKAKQLVVKRALAYAGLARRAVSMLMYKTNTKKINDGLLNPRVEVTAMENTRKREMLEKSGDGKTGKYGLFLEDELRYALKAVKGGKATLDIQTKKALNKIVGLMNQKLKKSDDIFSPKKLPTPFPEVRQRK